MRTVGRAVLVVWAAAATVLAAACIAEPPRVDAEKTIEQSLLQPGAVVFRTEGDALDAALASGASLSLDAAIRRSVETSPELQAALARVRVAQAEADLAGLLPNPILSLVFRFPEGGGKPDIEAGLSADVLAILQRPRRASAAGKRLEAEGASALSTALDVVAETQELYAQVQALDELVPLLEQRLEVFQRVRDVAQTRLELGEGTRHDVTALDTERVELEVEASRRRQELQLARITLARRIGEPSGRATWRLEPWRATARVGTEEPRWVATALRSRPELLAIEWELRARGDDAALSEWGALDGSSAGVEAEREEDWSIGPSISGPVPVFDTGNARGRRARALQAEVRHRLTEAQRKVVEDVRTSLAALSGSQESLARVVDELIPLQERRRSEIEEAYRVGHVDVTALLLAEQALQATQAQRVELEREVTSAMVRLQRAVGGPAALSSTLAAPDQEAAESPGRE